MCAVQPLPAALNATSDALDPLVMAALMDSRDRAFCLRVEQEFLRLFSDQG
jgi:hypothetical protein